MASAEVGRTWDLATSPHAGKLARLYESAWRGSDSNGRPNPLDFLPHGGGDSLDSGVRLALLRTDLTLRREAGESIRVEDYVRRFPDLDDDSIVGLAYEEFCLREEDDEQPKLAEYIARFPSLEGRLRRVLGIHDLVGGTPTTALHHAFSAPDASMPKVGETIAGFRLVQELGRGAFARVFRAEESTLGDRPVALKLSRAASREPQALARLQHTHIVPVHSYQTDETTGLNLLCMPFFGRVTLAHLLADPTVRSSQTGDGLAEALDRLDSGISPLSSRSQGRAALTRRPFARAIAWWGARLAEALQHAHDRGVLHRDIKPSNVLITADGQPMLLDFNLAWEPWVFGAGEEGGILGGTLDYMAPEHLDALSHGDGGKLDGRADVYSLGVVLFEALADRPFEPAPRGNSMDDSLARLVAGRMGPPPRLHSARVDVPPELEIVIRKCLEPDPEARYARPADLAEDLQAVVDDAPLKHAREPVLGAAVRWVRRRRRSLALGALLALGLILVRNLYVEIRSSADRRVSEIQGMLSDGDGAMNAGQLELAKVMFQNAKEQAEGIADRDLQATIHEKLALARNREARAKQADDLHSRADRLRLRLLQFIEPGDLATDLVETLKPFYVLDQPDWALLDGPALLDERRRLRLRVDVDDLLFYWACTLDRTGGNSAASGEKGAWICRRALESAESQAPWHALLTRFEASSRGRERPLAHEPDPAAVTATDAFRWGLIRQLENNDNVRGLAWLRLAARLKSDDYWFAYYLALALQQAGQTVEAQTYFGNAIALRNTEPWPYFNRAQLYHARGEWSLALADLKMVRKLTVGNPYRLAELEEAHVRMSLGDTRNARQIFVGLSTKRDEIARAARLNTARLDAEDGQVERALTGLDQLLRDWPDDVLALLARSQIHLMIGRYSAAEADLDHLLNDLSPSPARRGDILTTRARVRLALGRPLEALADIDKVAPSARGPGLDRLRMRAQLAAGKVEEIHPIGPECFDLLPLGGRAMEVDLRNAASALRIADNIPLGPESIGPLLTRAAILATLGDGAADAEASRAVDAAPGSDAARLLRARVRWRLKDREGAAFDIAAALGLDPSDPQALELRGRTRLESRDYHAALDDFDLAIRRGADGPIRASRAEALAGLGRFADAIEDWTQGLRSDAEDPRIYLGRARSFLALELWDLALADLESAAHWAGMNPKILGEIRAEYARCVPHRPDSKPRAEQIDRRSTQAARDL